MQKLLIGLIVVAVVLGFFALRGPAVVVPSHASAVVTPQNRVLAAGAGYVVALDEQGRVFGWGSADIPEGTQRLSRGERPRELLQGSWFTQVSAGNRAIYALNGRGQLWRAGLSDVGKSPAAPIAPTGVFVDRNWKLAGETWGMGFGITRTGGLWYWSDEQLQDHLQGRSAFDAPLRSPRQLMLGTRFVDACIQGARLHAIDESGKLWRSQDLQRRGSDDGPLQGDRTGLEALSVDGHVRQVYCRENASHVLALDDHGRLFGYGLNLFGELGVGTPDYNAGRAALQATTLVPISERRWIALAVGPQVSLGIADDGSLWGWGRNLDQELGLGDATSAHAPTLIDRSRPWVAVTTTYGAGVALSAAGELYAWGSNATGALGDGGIARSHGRPAAVLTDIRFGRSNGAR